MGRLLADIDLDRLSFWIGFLAASLFWGFVILIRPMIARFILTLRLRFQSLRQDMMAGVDLHLSNDTLQYIQGSHLADRLFSLDEVLITPRLLAPPPLVVPDEEPPSEDLITEILPYTPDWPELAVLYGTPTFTLAEALQQTSRLVLIGRPGSGKTVALAHLASQIIRKDKIRGYLEERTPIFIHACNLALPPKNPENLLETIYNAATPYASTLTLPRLLTHLEHLFQNNKALLLIDGLDELPPKNIDEIVQFIGELLNKYPSTGVVTTASLDYYDGITALDFTPVAMASWDESQRAEFIRKWSGQWGKYVGPSFGGSERTDPVLLNAWLLQDRSPHSPLELTLKVWATYAGDTLGSKSAHAVEAYLRRMTVDIPNGRLALERIARGVIRTNLPVFEPQDAEGWLSAAVSNPFPVEEPSESGDPIGSEGTSASRGVGNISASRLLPDLQANGLILKRLDGKYQIVHPQILSFLAGTSLAYSPDIEFVERGSWTSAAFTLGYYALKGDADLINAYLQSDSAPNHRQLFHAALWLRDAEKKASWRLDVVRGIVDLVRDDKSPAGLRMRGAAALATCGVQGISSLFIQLMAAPDSQLHLIAALGSGVVSDPALVESLVKLIRDPAENVRRAACFALVAMGTQTALETVADVLLTGEEDMRRTAAEALANNREEGHPTLKEGATLEDILIRRAAIYGLRRVGQPWAIQLLEQIQIEDSQWAVKNIAAQALIEINRPNPRLPRRFQPLTETPWVIAFAAERGIGVSPGKPARALVIQALNEGKPEQKLAALDYLLRHATQEDLPAIYQLLDNTPFDIREAAYNTLWHLELSGLKHS